VVVRWVGRPSINDPAWQDAAPADDRSQLATVAKLAVKAAG
jgi:hypothetical protein